MDGRDENPTSIGAAAVCVNAPAGGETGIELPEAHGQENSRRAGAIGESTGVSAPYAVPARPELALDTNG